MKKPEKLYDETGYMIEHKGLEYIKNPKHLNEESLGLEFGIMKGE
jgi:hypothetical protein